jgi:hypothetical protein
LDLAIFFGRDKATNTKRLRDIPLGLALPRSFSHFDNLDKNISDIKIEQSASPISVMFQIKYLLRLAADTLCSFYFYNFSESVGSSYFNP